MLGFRPTYLNLRHTFDTLRAHVMNTITTESQRIISKLHHLDQARHFGRIAPRIDLRDIYTQALNSHNLI
jgi:hypothetical protein